MSEKTHRLTTAQALVRYLCAQWSERDGMRRRVIPAVFGIFGHGNVCGVGQALEEASDELKYLQPKNEQAMVHTAIGYAKANDRLATLACTASIGPGSTNMITGAATATVNRLPVLLLPSDTFANRKQGPVLQQLEHPAAGDISVNDCFRPVSRFFDRITRPEQLLTALPEAIRVLLDPAETGAATISLHQDVEGEAYEFPDSFFEPHIWHVVRRLPAPEEIAAAVELVRASNRPLLIAGGGVRYSGAQTELADLSALLGIPVAETSAGKGTLPNGQLLLGGIGVNGTRAANAIAREADAVICVGTRLTDFTTGSHSLFQRPGVRFLGINVCAADANKLAATAVVADAKRALDSLGKALVQVGWATDAGYQTEVRERRNQWHRELNDDLTPREGEQMTQGQLLRALNEQSQAGDVVIAAAGFLPGDVLKSWDCSDGTVCHIEFGYSCMGHEIPAALGYRMARPSQGEVYALVGDGTYLLANSELATAVQESLKVTVVVVENGGYQSIRALQLATTGKSFGNELRHRDRDSGRLTGERLPIDYGGNAASLGCAVLEADSPASLSNALAAARSQERTTVIVAHVEPGRTLLDSSCWWDLGVAAVSQNPRSRQLSAAHQRSSAQQRFHGAPPNGPEALGVEP